MKKRNFKKIHAERHPARTYLHPTEVYVPPLRQSSGMRFGYYTKVEGELPKENLYGALGVYGAEDIEE